MSKRVPRRLKRFYRNNQHEEKTDDSFYEKAEGLPTMEYEDVGQENYNDLKKYEAENLAQKLALLEVENFKKEKKRLPNKKESEGIAANVFDQLKEENLPNAKEKVRVHEERKRGRHRDRRNNKKETSEERDIPLQTNNKNDLKEAFDLNEDNTQLDSNEFSLDLDIEEKPSKKKKKGKSKDIPIGDDFDLGDLSLE